MIRTSVTVLVLLYCALVPAFAQAQGSGDQHPLLTSKYHLAAGAYFGSGDFEISADGSSPGTGIDFGRTLDADESDASPFGTFLWRFGDKWSLRMQAFELDVSGGRVLDHDVQFGDVTFKEGSRIDAGLDTTVIRAFMGRTFSTGTQHEFGAGVGLHWMQLDAFVSGEILVNDQTPAFSRESVSADLPLPNIGAWYWYAPTNRWLVTSRIDWLSASVGDYSGSLWNVGLGVQYQLSKHFGIGMEYEYFDLDGDIEDTNWKGSATISTNGPSIFVTASW